MKKMKKLFSKIVTLVLLVAMLIPFTNIPKVEADEECTSGWQYHTNYYFFIQAEYPLSWAQMTLNYDSDGVDRNESRYWTSFLYNFPSDGSTVDFDCEDCSHGFVYLDEEEDAITNDFDPSSEESREEWGLADFYDQYMIKYDNSTYQGALSEYLFEVDSDDENRIINYSFHGDWANVTYEKSSKKWNLNDADLHDADDDLELDDARIKQLIKATIILDPDSTEIDNVKIGSASKNAMSSNNTYDMDDVFRSINSYSANKDGRNVINSYNISGYGKVPVLDLVIGREYEPEQLFNTSAGEDVTDMTEIEYDAEGNVTAYKVKYNGQETTLDFSKTETSGIYVDGNKVSNKVAVKLYNPSTNDKEYWYLAPSLYQISYRVCQSSTQEGNVTLTYKGNEASVKSSDTATNIPGPDTKTSGSEFTISKQEPSLKDYKFLGWSTSESCTDTKEPGVSLGKLTDHKTLYACWGTTNGTEGPGTGVLTYAGLFTGIIALAGGTYYIIKKKNIFKKI